MGEYTHGRHKSDSVVDIPELDGKVVPDYVNKIPGSQAKNSH